MAEDSDWDFSKPGIPDSHLYGSRNLARFSGKVTSIHARRKISKKRYQKFLDSNLTKIK